MKYSTIALTLVILIDVIVILNFFEWDQRQAMEFEERLIDIQVNYGVDAGAAAMLKETPDVDTAYTDWGHILVDPSAAFDTYVNVMMRGMGWGISSNNYSEFVDSTIPYFCVATYDGYYMYQRVIEESTDGTRYYALMCSPKIPYWYCPTEDVTDNNAGVHMKQDKTYCFNLAAKSYFTIANDDGSYSVANIETIQKDNDKYISPLTMRELIAYRLDDACTRALLVGTDYTSVNSITLPGDTNIASSNGIYSPTIITDFIPPAGAVHYEVQTKGFGGARIKEASFVVGYTYKNSDSTLRYLYVSQDVFASKESFFYEDGKKLKSEYSNLRVFNSAVDAAVAGYSYDIRLLE